jgi:hypothetical protein
MHRLSSHAHTDQIVIVCSYAVVQLLQCLHESFPDCRHARSRWDRAHAHLPCIAAGRRLAPCGSESSRANTDPASRLSACRLKICKWDHSHTVSRQGEGVPHAAADILQVWRASQGLSMGPRPRPRQRPPSSVTKLCSHFRSGECPCYIPSSRPPPPPPLLGESKGDEEKAEGSCGQGGKIDVVIHADDSGTNGGRKGKEGRGTGKEGRGRGRVAVRL